MKTKIFFSALLLCVLFSCKKKDKASTNCDKTMASIAGSYSIIKLEIGTNGTFQDITNQLEACQLDDKLSLGKDGVFIYQDLGAACSPPGTTTGSWNISSSGKLTINGNGTAADVESADITSFDCSTLVLTEPDPTTPGDEVRLTLKK